MVTNETTNCNANTNSNGRIRIIPQRIHTKMPTHLFVDDLISIKLNLFHGPFSTPQDNVTARVEHIEDAGSGSCLITATLLSNHRQLESLDVGLTIEDVDIDVFGSENEPFEEEMYVPEDFADALFEHAEEEEEEEEDDDDDVIDDDEFWAALTESNQGNIGRIIHKKRLNADTQLLYDACTDPAVAARVFHTGPGIQTRNRFYRSNIL